MLAFRPDLLFVLLFCSVQIIKTNEDEENDNN